MDKALTNRHEM